MKSSTADNPTAADARTPPPAPILVELEGELVACDLHWEARLLLLKHAPFQAIRLGRRAVFHPVAISRLSEEASALPYRRETLESLSDHKRAGRHVVLVGSVPQEVMDAIAGHVKLFDEVMPADRAGGHRLAAAPSWHAGDLIRALRPHQWLKNLLLLLPLILAHQVSDRSRLLAGMLAFCSMSFCASAVYILNDLLDISADRRHPTKRFRPFASGRASVPAGMLLGIGMLAAGWGLAAILSPAFRLMLLGYLLLTTAYSLWLKQKILVDVILLSVLYTWRIIAGATAVHVPLTMWLLAFSMFFFLSMAFAKRYSELIRVEDDGGVAVRGRGYCVSDLRIIETVGPASGYLSVLVFCNYLDSAMVRSLYPDPQVLWLVAPLLLYWITRMWFMAGRKLLDDDPVIYAVKDPASCLTGVLVAAIVAAAWFPKPHWWPF